MPALPEIGLTAAALLLQGLTGVALPVRALPAPPPDQPAPRPVVEATQLLLPVSLLGRDAQVLRAAAVAHAAAHLLHSPAAQPVDTLKPLSLAVISAFEDARVEALLLQRWPGARHWFLAGLRASLRPDALDAAGLLSRLDLALLDTGYADGNHWVQKARALFGQVRAAHGLADPAPFRRAAAVLAYDLGQMRVRFDARQHSVPGAYRDDHSYLWQHRRNADSPTSVQAPAQPARTGPAPADAPDATALPPLPYPEWNYRSGVLRQDWCLLHESAATPDPQTPPPASTVRLPPLRPRGTRGRPLRAQPDGEELDLDAALDARLAQRLRAPHDGHVYRRRGPGGERLSLLLLLDLSQSTADSAPGSGRSLLALEQQAAWLLAAAARAAGDRVAVHGFCSDTRARVHYHRLLDFHTPLDAAARSSLAAVQPRYSTRLGTAVRHAVALLAQENAAQRVLLVLTDSLPSDIDVHDARYLVEDARHAVQSAARRQVAVYGLAVDAAGARYARRIFGPRRHRVLTRAEQLPRQLQALYAQLTSD